MDELLRLLDAVTMPDGEYIRIKLFTDISGDIEHLSYDGDVDCISSFDNKDELIASVRGVFDYFNQKPPESCLFNKEA